jgi:hypothetical protein
LPAVAKGAPFRPCIQPLAIYPKTLRAFSYERLRRLFLDVFGLTRQYASANLIAYSLSKKPLHNNQAPERPDFE